MERTVKLQLVNNGMFLLSDIERMSLQKMFMRKQVFAGPRKEMVFQ